MPATYETIATTTLTSSAANITFSSIPTTYTDLRLVYVGTGVAGVGEISYRFNNDSGANYSLNYLRATGGGAFSTYFSDYTRLNAGIFISPSFISTNIVDIFSYASTSVRKTVFSSVASDENNSQGYVVVCSGVWLSTSAINSITVFANGGNLVSGTTASLFGIKAA